VRRLQDLPIQGIPATLELRSGRSRKARQQACGQLEEAEEIALIKRRWNEYRWKAAMENRKAVA
jgi:hypothetical protein